MSSYHRPVILVALFGLLAVLRIAAPSDLLEGDQVKQIGYIMDLLHHRDWVVQYEITGEVSTKPPLYNWLAAGVCLLCDTRAEWAMKFPSLLAAVGWLVCLYVLGKHFFDERVAFYACLSCIASHHFSKLMWFARTDMLLACLVLSAITLLVRLRWCWWKSPLIGLIVALAALTKGPIGPALFGLFLLAWGWHHDALRSPVGWRRTLSGAAVLVLVCGTWLIAAWQMPRFEHVTIRWQLGERMMDPEKTRSLFYYVGHVLTRIAPWPVLAGIGYWLSRRRNEATNAQFVLIWFVLSFALLSLIPVKRHDHLLPIYPALFLLSGLGLRYLVEPVLTAQAFWIMYPLSAALVAAPILFPWAQRTPLIAMISGAFICGAAASWCFLQRQRISMAVIAAGLICIHGVYHHGLMRPDRADYTQLLTFVNEVRRTVPEGEKVVVFQAHPLIAYELGQHDRLPDPSELLAARPEWVIMPDYFHDRIAEENQWRLTPQANMTIPPREERATLFRVEPPAQLSSHPDRAVR